MPTCAISVFPVKTFKRYKGTYSKAYHYHRSFHPFYKVKFSWQLRRYYNLFYYNRNDINSKHTALREAILWRDKQQAHLKTIEHEEKTESCVGEHYIELTCDERQICMKQTTLPPPDVSIIKNKTGYRHIQDYH